jgi:Holliday junction resolvasome RuvABC endonuclease subunit
MRTRDLVFGFDPASSAGWAVFDLDGNVVESGAWAVGKDGTDYPGDRWMMLEQAAASLLDRYPGRIAAAAIERPSTVQWNTARVLFGQAAIIEWVCARAGVESVLVAPSSIKKAATGDGRADKSVVRDAMADLAPLQARTAKGREDEADARGACVWLLATHDRAALKRGELSRSRV